jgi:cell division protein FtsB
MYSVPVLVVLFVVFVFFASRVFGLYQKESDVRKKSEEVRADLAHLKAQKSELQDKIKFMETERGKEEELRSRFMVGKEGEGVIIVIDEKATTTANSQSQKSSSWWTRFFNFFK